MCPVRFVTYVSGRSPLPTFSALEGGPSSGHQRGKTDDCLMTMFRHASGPARRQERFAPHEQGSATTRPQAQAPSAAILSPWEMLLRRARFAPKTKSGRYAATAEPMIETLVRQVSNGMSPHAIRAAAAPETRASNRKLCRHPFAPDRCRHYGQNASI